MKNKVANDTSDYNLKNAKVVYIHSIPPYWRDYEIEQPTEEGIYVCLGAVSGRARQLDQHFVDFCDRNFGKLHTMHQHGEEVAGEMFKTVGNLRA